jgi:hypothetical protein
MSLKFRNYTSIKYKPKTLPVFAGQTPRKISVPSMLIYLFTPIVCIAGYDWILRGHDVINRTEIVTKKVIIKTASTINHM